MPPGPFTLGAVEVCAFSPTAQTLGLPSFTASRSYSGGHTYNHQEWGDMLDW